MEVLVTALLELRRQLEDMQAEVVRQKNLAEAAWAQYDSAKKHLEALGRAVQQLDVVVRHLKGEELDEVPL
jgi:hypothetical protein